MSFSPTGSPTPYPTVDPTITVMPTSTPTSSPTAGEEGPPVAVVSWSADAKYNRASLTPKAFRRFGRGATCTLLVCLGPTHYLSSGRTISLTRSLSISLIYSSLAHSPRGGSDTCSLYFCGTSVSAYIVGSRRTNVVYSGTARWSLE